MHLTQRSQKSRSLCGGCSFCDWSSEAGAAGLARGSAGGSWLCWVQSRHSSCSCCHKYVFETRSQSSSPGGRVSGGSWPLSPARPAVRCVLALAVTGRTCGRISCARLGLPVCGISRGVMFVFLK